MSSPLFALGLEADLTPGAEASEFRVVHPFALAGVLSSGLSRLAGCAEWAIRTAPTLPKQSEFQCYCRGLRRALVLGSRKYQRLRRLRFRSAVCETLLGGVIDFLRFESPIPTSHP